MYYPEGMKARVSPVQSIEPHRILAHTRESDDRILTVTCCSEHVGIEPRESVGFQVPHLGRDGLPRGSPQSATGPNDRSSTELKHERVNRATCSLFIYIFGSPNSMRLARETILYSRPAQLCRCFINGFV